MSEDETTSWMQPGYQDGHERTSEGQAPVAPPRLQGLGGIIEQRIWALDQRMQALDQHLRALKVQEQDVKAFSKVGSLEAKELLQRVGILKVDDHEHDPVVVPAGTPDCSSFDYSKFDNRNEGTPDLLKHHEAQLTKLGVVFGRGGCTMFDLHTEPALYTVTTSTKAYQGNIDACVAPYGLVAESAAQQCRVAYEHKQSPRQNQAYRDKRGEASVGQVTGTSAVRFEASCKGQAIASTIDGAVHHMLQVRGDKLFEWTDLSPQQAYYMQAKFLKDNMQPLSKRRLTVDAIHEELQQPMKKLQGLRPSSMLQEQLDSIVPELALDEEGSQCTPELMDE